MPSPDPYPGPAWLICRQEFRGLLLFPAVWLMLVILSLLTGYSFLQAVDLYSQASRTALDYPQLAAGMNPLDGILVPTFGAYYLTQTLLLPFIAIRVIGLDRQNGTLKLLLQLPLTTRRLCSLKLAAMLAVWIISLLPAAVVLICWKSLGGHLYFPELLVLLTGHGLYALVVITIALFTATITDSLPTAAMCCLAVTLGSWVLDFALAGRGRLEELFGGLSLIGMLHRFETGLFDLHTVFSLLALAGLFFLLTVFWLHPGRRLRARLRDSLLALLGIALFLRLTLLFPLSLDLSENRRHSFNPADARALATLELPLDMTIHLSSGDSRLLDLQQDLLAKLRRTVPCLRVHFPVAATGSLFGTSDEKYGLIEIAYAGKYGQTYSNSAEEILPIIYRLAGLQVSPEPVPTYRGYPLVADGSAGGGWFFLLLPGLFVSFGVYFRKK